jgi:signal transduction histidine kinase
VPAARVFSRMKTFCKECKAWYAVAMPGSRYGSWATLAVVLVLALSLGVLATLQYRWIDEVSRAEQQRLRASLTAAAERFGEDFDRELARVFHYFLLRPPSAEGVEERLAERYRLWLAGAPYPDLVGDLWLAYRSDRGDGGSPRLRRLDAESGRFVDVPWPAGLAPVRGWGGVDDGARQLLLADVPALVVPVPHGPLVVVGLDREFLTATLPAELTERHFAGGDGLDYDVALVTQTEPPRALFRSDPALPLDRYLPGDVRVDLFGLRWFHDLAIGPGLAPGLDGPPFGPPPTEHGPRGLHHRRPGVGGRPGLAAGSLDPPRWRLVVNHRAGSLEAAVARARRHNLAVSLGVLALLAGSIGVLAVSARRAERLARQQLEFVAGVTHELHTPLAAICAAGENLADGVVAEADQVRRYGATIRDAGRRLAGQVAQALELAGMQSGRESYRFAPVAVDGVVDAALEDCRWEIEERGIEVERDLPGGLPPVAGDAEALRRVLRNLLGNAIKYGGAGRWLAVRARAAGDGVTIAVEDRGPGIHRRDLPHLFAPFYRGREAAAGGVAGSGIGLAVVQRIVAAHGGRVGVEARAEGGSRFTVRLPVAAGEPEGAPEGAAAGAVP